MIIHYAYLCFVYKAKSISCPKTSSKHCCMLIEKIKINDSLFNQEFLLYILTPTGSSNAITLAENNKKTNLKQHLKLLFA